MRPELGERTQLDLFMLTDGQASSPGDAVTAEGEHKAKANAWDVL